MTKLIILGLIAFALFIVLDLLWFSFAGNILKKEVSSIARLSTDGNWNINYFAAGAAYIFMSVGIVLFVLPNAVSLPMALLFGGLFGLISFGIYDMTNMATLSAWTWKFVALDMTWGTTVNALVTTATYYLSRIFFA